MSIDRTKNPTSNYTICTSGTRPSSPNEGQFIYETDTDKQLVYDGSAWRELTKADQYSTASGQQVLLASATPSSVASFTLSSSLPTSGFVDFIIRWYAGHTSTGGVDLLMRLNNISTSTYDVTVQYTNYGAGPSRYVSGAVSGARVAALAGTTASKGHSSGEIRIPTPHTADRLTSLLNYNGEARANYWGGGVSQIEQTVWVNSSTSITQADITRVDFLTGANNFAAGSRFYLYGVRA